MLDVSENYSATIFKVNQARSGRKTKRMRPDVGHSNPKRDGEGDKERAKPR
jgi:hypothetical protein